MRIAALLIVTLIGLSLFAGCASDKSAEVSKSAPACVECVNLKDAGETGWCSQCGTGFYEGKEVMCKGSCGANPGGPPCRGCVKN